MGSGQTCAIEHLLSLYPLTAVWVVRSAHEEGREERKKISFN